MRAKAPPFLAPHSNDGTAWDRARGQSQDGWPQMAKMMFSALGCYVQQITAGEIIRQGGMHGVMCLSSFTPRAPSQPSPRLPGTDLALGLSPSRGWWPGRPGDSPLPWQPCQHPGTPVQLSVWHVTGERGGNTLVPSRPDLPPLQCTSL